MATVYNLLPTRLAYYALLQAYAGEGDDDAEARRYRRFHAVRLLQRMARGYLIRKHVAWLCHNAIIIQCAFRVHQARKAYRAALRIAAKLKHYKFYFRAATRIQALWRGYYSRRTKFSYAAYRRWLATVKERGERRAAEAAEFGIRSRADDLKILEEEARQWLAYVMFKLHHLLRTQACAGIYSKPASTQLSEFEILLKSIHYTEYMKRLRRKYEQFVRKHRPQFSNKRLFPVIGDGTDYWYLSLPEMYELTAPANTKVLDTRHKATHHGPQHKKPFLWKRVRPGPCDGRGPFDASIIKTSSNSLPSAPAPTATFSAAGDASQHDPRFNIYVKHYTPQPNLFDFVDFHVNALLARRFSIENISTDPNSGKLS